MSNLQDERTTTPKRKKRTLRNVVRSVGAVVFVVVVIHIIHALTLDRTIEYTEVSFSSPHVTQELDGYRIAFISDTHELSEEDMRIVAEELNRMDVDLLVLGGDYSSYGKTPHWSMEILSQITTTDGVYGVAGNHDNSAEVFALMNKNGITPLANSGLRVRDNLYLSGVKDLWSGDASISRATEGAAPEDFVLLVAHNPDITMTRETKGIDLVLSGHTHGGQITFFGFFAPALLLKNITDYGHRFLSGWSTSEDGTSVFVSRGVGKFKNVPRVFARPQVVLITLHAS